MLVIVIKWSDFDQKNHGIFELNGVISRAYDLKQFLKEEKSEIIIESNRSMHILNSNTENKLPLPSNIGILKCYGKTEVSCKM